MTTSQKPDYTARYTGPILTGWFGLLLVVALGLGLDVTGNPFAGVGVLAVVSAVTLVVSSLVTRVVSQVLKLERTGTIAHLVVNVLVAAGALTGAAALLPAVVAVSSVWTAAVASILLGAVVAQLLTPTSILDPSNWLPARK